MLKWGLGIAFLMAFSVSSSDWITIADLDWKQAERVVMWQSELDESDVDAREVKGDEPDELDAVVKDAEEREIEEGYILSEGILFTKDFQRIEYGDVIGSMEVEFTNIDCDIIYAENKADAFERSDRPGGDNYVYLFYQEGGQGLNASYMNFYAPQKLMPDRNMVDEAGDVNTRYLHTWIRVGEEELKMDISGIYYSDDMATDQGFMTAITESELLPPDAGSESEKIAYIGQCLNKMPEGIEYDRLITICSYDTDYKRIIVAVNLAN